MTARIWRNVGTIGNHTALLVDRGEGASPRYVMGQGTGHDCTCCGMDPRCIAAEPLLLTGYQMKVVLPSNPFADDDCGECDAKGGTYYLDYQGRTAGIDQHDFWYEDDDWSCICYGHAAYFYIGFTINCGLVQGAQSARCRATGTIGWYEKTNNKAQQWTYFDMPTTCKTIWTLPYYTHATSCPVYPSYASPCQSGTYPSSLTFELIPP